MTTIKQDSHVYRLLTFLSYVGEYPLCSLQLFGSKEVWRKLIHKHSQRQEYRIPGHADKIICRLLLITGKGKSKSVRLSKGGQNILEIVNPNAALSSLFFSFLFIKLTRFADLSPGGRCPVPVNLILDEFNNIGRIGGAPDGSDFCRSLSVIRSRDIRVMLAVQSLGQLQNRYPNNLWSEIIGNCDIQLMLGCTDDVTADYISDRSGEMCIVVDSTMTVKKTVAVTQVIPQYRETQGQGKRKLLTPDEVLRLPHEQMLVIIRGQNLLLLNKFDYTRHPMSKEMVRASIMDYCPRTSYAPTPQTGSENEPDKKPQRESRGRKLNRDDPDDIRVAASVKQVAANPVDKALEKIEVNSNYAGTVTLTDSTGIFVRLDMGAECRCRFPYRARPPKGARVVVKIAGVDMEQKTVWGNITYVTIPK